MGPSDFWQRVVPVKESTVRKNRNLGKRGVVASILLMWILTFLELPKPMGFETRSQENVSRAWLMLFLAILVCEVWTIVAVFRRPELGAKLALAAAVLNIFQIIADQTHMMQPEVAPFAYSLLEYSVGVVSLGLMYFAWKILRPKAVL